MSTPATATTTIDLEAELTRAYVGQYREILHGVPKGEPTWVTNGGPEGGVLGTLSDVTAAEASRDVHGSTIALHAEHLRWTLDLANDFLRGVEPPMDWSASWGIRTVDEQAWQALKQELARASEELLENLETRLDWRQPMAVDGILASYAHAAYHLGALRQLRKAVKKGATERE